MRSFQQRLTMIFYKCCEKIQASKKKPIYNKSFYMCLKINWNIFWRNIFVFMLFTRYFFISDDRWSGWDPEVTNFGFVIVCKLKKNQAMKLSEIKIYLVKSIKAKMFLQKDFNPLWDIYKTRNQRPSAFSSKLW